MELVKIKMIHPNARMPFKAHTTDFCYDVVATSEEEIAPNVWKYGLGFAIQLVRRTSESIFYISQCIDLRPRSSVWKTGMVLSNCIGTIDEGYTGEVSAVFYHVMPNMPRYKVGDKIGQIVFSCSVPLEFEQVDELEPTERGDGGYGSTDKK